MEYFSFESQKSFDNNYENSCEKVEKIHKILDENSTEIDLKEFLTNQR